MSFISMMEKGKKDGKLANSLSHGIPQFSSKHYSKLFI
jgi:hypothetical protein